MTDYTFLIGKYTDKDLEKELAGLLAAAQAKAAPQSGKKKWMGLVFGVVMLLLGVYLLITALRDGHVSICIGIALVIVGVSYLDLVWICRAATAQRPVAKRLLQSLNSIEASNQAAVVFSEDGMSIRAKDNEASVSYSDISAAAASARLYVLLHQGAATVLQKRDLLDKDPETFTAYLIDKIDGRFISHTK